jgi:tetratricopeptide (TPR) repeat protein
LASAHAGIGVAKIYLGRSEETEAHITEAFRFSPRDTNAYLWMFAAGLAKLFLGRDEEAVAWLRHAIETNRNYPPAHLWLAAALAHLIRLEEARAADQVGLALNPSFTIARYRAGAPSDHPIFFSSARAHL